MKYLGPFMYTLFVSGTKDKRVIYKKEQIGENVNFQKPVTEKSRPKIYILKSENELIYIGYTGQSISSRLNYGMRANGRNGYHGYKWKNELDSVDLYVFVFEPFSGNEKDNKKYKQFVEAIEAELVYKVRKETDFWPRSQSEIHFNNKQSEEVRNIATFIYNSLG
jgi:hypothetical protein